MVVPTAPCLRTPRTMMVRSAGFDLRFRRSPFPASRQFRQLNDEPECLVYGFLGGKCPRNIRGQEHQVCSFPIAGSILPLDAIPEELGEIILGTKILNLSLFASRFHFHFFFVELGLAPARCMRLPGASMGSLS